MGELLHKFPEETSIFGHICRKPANFTPDLGSNAVATYGAERGKQLRDF